MNKKDLSGQRFGRLTVIEEAGRSKNKTILWRCSCDCGSETITLSTSLRNGNSRSCGCLQKEISTKHGLSNHKMAHIWYDMLYRCYNKKNKYYKNYGGRGISVCKRWHSLENFIKDMSASYDEHKLNNDTTQIDRIDNNGNYEPSNCKWSTCPENNQNTSKMIHFIAISPDGKNYKSKNQSEFARKYNLDNSAISKCIKGKFKQHKGWKFYKDTL